jgi:hypothetical protein
LGTKRKHDFEPYWQDEKDWLCTVGFLATMIRKLGRIPQTLLTTWSAMQICPTRALWRFSAIPTPALTNCFSPFRLLKKDQFPDLVRSLEDLGDDYGTCFIPIRRYASMSSNFVSGLRSSSRAGDYGQSGGKLDELRRPRRRRPGSLP